MKQYLKTGQMRRCFAADLGRCLSSRRLVPVILAVAWLMCKTNDETGPGQEWYNRFEWASSVIKIYIFHLHWDRYQTVIVLLLAGLLTDSFCTDRSNHYFRCIISRCPVRSYAAGRFLANTACIVGASLVSTGLFAAIYVANGVPLGPDRTSWSMIIYTGIAERFPVLYLALMAVSFGLVASAGSAIGLLFSAVSPNAFVSIGLSGFTWFLASSLIPTGSIFDLKLITPLIPPYALTDNLPLPLCLAWQLGLPCMVIVICCIGFTVLLNRQRKEGRW